jgi:hypothetical protein
VLPRPVGKRRIAVITANIARFSRGEPLVNVVDKKRGH